MKIAFISGPYRAPTEHQILDNIRKAESTAIKYWRKGFAVICPHKNTAFLGGACPDQTWLDGCLEMIRRSDVVVALPGWQNSAGSQQEIALAKKLGKEIIYELDD